MDPIKIIAWGANPMPNTWENSLWRRASSYKDEYSGTFSIMLGTPLSIKSSIIEELERWIQ